MVIDAVDPEIDLYVIDEAETDKLRRSIRQSRRSWLATDPEEVAARYRNGELEMLDLVRRYGVIVDWGTGDLLPTTTGQFRELLETRAASHWS